MNLAVVTGWISRGSPSLRARVAGGLSLLSVLAAVFGEFVVRRLELAGDLIALAGMIAFTILLYYILKPVNRSLALLGASINLVGIACGIFQWNPRGVDMPVVLHGFSCFVTGCLIFKSIFLPRMLGGFVVLAGLGWVTYVSPQFAAHLSPYNLAAALVGEVSLMLWFLVKGVNDQRWKEQAGE